MNPNRLNRGKLEEGHLESKILTATGGEIRSTLSFVSWRRARMAMMLSRRARISSEDPSLASDEVHDVETERDTSLSGTALGSLSTKLSLQFFLSLLSLRDWSLEPNLFNKISKTEWIRRNKNTNANENRSSNWQYEFYCGAEIREGEGGVAERRSRAEATVSSRGDGDGAIASQRAFSFFLFLKSGGLLFNVWKLPFCYVNRRESRVTGRVEDLCQVAPGHGWTRSIWPVEWNGVTNASRTTGSAFEKEDHFQAS